MLKRILPKEEKYFDRFDQMSDLLAQASATMMTAVDHSAEASAKAMVLSEYEVQADQITHTILGYLHRTFITPFDRNDIHALVFKMQKVVELLSGTVCHLVDYKLTELSPDIKSLAKQVDEQVMLVSSAVPGLRNLKDSEQLVELCGKIHQVKYRSRAISRRIAADLLEADDLKLMIKLRDLVSNLNQTISCSVDIAQRIEVIVLEYA
ncbi:MAG: DUF47 family protein [Bdellovibrionia bacterium]